MKIGNIELNTPLALAPMAGVTDLAFRRICRDLGAELTCTEMVSSRALVYQDGKTNRLLEINKDEHPSAVQIFGNDPQVMAQAAELALERSGADIVDINMGCPTPKIVSNGDGCALMRNPELASEIISHVARAVSAPVTVKFRIGWDRSCINAVDFAKMAEAAGAAAICVHGRTRVQLYSGRADWDVIREVVGATSLPVFANGDIFCAEDALKALRYTGAAGVMIGRAAFGNPWIFEQTRAALGGEEIPPLPPLRERLEVAHTQFKCAAEQKGEHIAALEARKYYAWYLKGVRYANYYKDKVSHLSTAEEISRLTVELQDTLK